MSETSYHYLSLDADEVTAGPLIDGITAWLVETEAIVRDDDRSKDPYDRCPYVAGPSGLSLLASDYTPRPLIGVLGCVEPRAEWACIDSGSNLEDAPCPRCGALLPFEGERMFAWLDTREEPTVQCAGCGYRGLLGDWESVFTAYCSYAWVSFRYWDWILAPEFELELLERLGPRSRKVYQHY